MQVEQRHREGRGMGRGGERCRGRGARDRKVYAHTFGVNTHTFGVNTHYCKISVSLGT